MEVNILKHLPDKTFIYIDDSIRHKMFEKLVKKSLTGLSLELSIKLKNLSRYKTGTRATTKNLFLKLVGKSGLRLCDFQDKIIIKVGKRGNKIKIGPYLTIDQNWIYISELIRGDGSLVVGNNNSYKTCFTNKDLLLIKYVKDFFLNLGIEDRSIGIYDHARNPDVKNLVVHSETISYFLNSFFSIPFGYKENIFLPKFIYLNKDFMLSAIRGIFDAEGSVQNEKIKGRNTRKVIIAMKDKEYMLSIQKILKKFNINSRFYKDKDKEMHRIVIGSRESIIRFYRKVKPLNVDKRRKLIDLVKSYKDSRWLSFNEIIPVILKCLSQGNKKNLEIVRQTNLSSVRLQWHLKRARQIGYIEVKKKIITNQGSRYVYGITEKGKNYLKEIV